MRTVHRFSGVIFLLNFEVNKLKILTIQNESLEKVALLIDEFFITLL